MNVYEVLVVFAFIVTFIGAMTLALTVAGSLVMTIMDGSSKNQSVDGGLPHIAIHASDVEDGSS